MSYSFPHFKSGNTSFANALNSVVAVIRKHGVNPGGRPGWAETENGWLPPYISATGGAGARFWDLEIVDGEAGQIKVSVPGKVRITDDVDSTGLITIESIDATLTMTVGKYLVLEWDATGVTTVCTLKALSTWSGFPFPYTTVTSGEHKIFQKGYTPLWVARAAEDFTTKIDGIHVGLNEAITLVRLAPDAHFEVINYLVELPTGEMVDVDKLMAGCGAG